MPLFEIDVLTTFRNKYVIEAETLEHAYDELVMTEHNREFDEITQKFLGELIIEGRETTPEGVTDTINRLKDDKSDIYLEVYITRPYGSSDREMPDLPTPPGGKYPGNLFFWFEIKDTITRLTEWYYSQTIYDPIAKNPNLYRWEKDESALRFFGSGIEMFFGFTNQKDFDGVGDLISFTNFRIELKV
jgi:hypothetical protein